MKFGPARIERHSDTCRYCVDIESAHFPDELWFSVDARYGDLLSSTADAALAGLIVPAMYSGEDIEITGPVSTKLVASLSGPFQYLAQSILEIRQTVAIEAHETTSVATGAKGVATGFSCGVDSYSVLADYFLQRKPGHPRLTHLLFHNVGAHGADRDRVFRERYTQRAPHAEKLGLPFVTVDSNLDDFYGAELGFRRTHTMRNAATALALQQGIGSYLYASSFAFVSVHAGPSYSSSHSDPMTLPLLSSESLSIQSVGCEYTRVEKTLQISGLGHAQASLNVCARPVAAENCSECWKCMRTQMTLEVAGCLDRFAQVFDLQKYEAAKMRFIASILFSKDDNEVDLLRFARDSGYSFPAASYVYAVLDKPATKYFELRRNLKSRWNVAGTTKAPET